MCSGPAERQRDPQNSSHSLETVREEFWDLADHDVSVGLDESSPYGVQSYLVWPISDATGIQWELPIQGETDDISRG